MGLHDEIRRMRRSVEGNMISLPQPDGSVARFPEGELALAFANLMQRMRAATLGHEAPDEHPLLAAARNSPDQNGRSRSSPPTPTRPASPSKISASDAPLPSVVPPSPPRSDERRRLLSIPLGIEPTPAGAKKPGGSKIPSHDGGAR